MSTIPTPSGEAPLIAPCGRDMRQEFQEKINNIPDMQTRMDMQRMLDALGNM